MLSFFSNNKNKWFLGFALMALAVGINAKNVISYPTECMPNSPLELNSIQIPK